MTQALPRGLAISTAQQPWLRSWQFDSAFIVAPSLLTSLIAVVFSNQMGHVKNVPLWAWVVFVLLVDVAHVYATLFRTYLDKRAFAKHRKILLIVPLLCWSIGSLLYAIGPLVFWRVLAYLAVFHFIRQQYGFMAVYSSKDPVSSSRFRWLDCLTIYMSAIYPVLYWHANLPRNFNWFVEGDFFGPIPVAVLYFGLCVYITSMVSYFIKEIVQFKTTGFFNIPRNLIVLATALSWWVGIVYLNSDSAFTMTNVVSHGIPYVALIWLYSKKSDSTGRVRRDMNSAKGENDYHPTSRTLPALLLSNALVFVAFLWMLAYLEEGFWDGLVWREHTSFFLPFTWLPNMSDSFWLILIVPLLSLPQSSHYIIDGFIWRIRDGSSSEWSVVPTSPEQSHSIEHNHHLD